MRFALVGCGRISASHMAALQQHRSPAELVAVCDNQPLPLRLAVEKMGAPGFESLDALLANCDADVVVLTTPSGLHPRQAMAAALAGRHVVTEKPMATKWDEGMEMVRVCRQAAAKLFVVKQTRLNATLQRVKQAVQQGRFGRVYMVSVNVFWTRPQSCCDEAPWRGRWDLDGGAFLNQASHCVDMVDWLVGPVDSVHAYTATLAREIEAEDTGVMSLRLRVGGVAVNRIEHWEFDQTLPADAQVFDASYSAPSVYGLGHPLYCDNVISTLRGEVQAEVDGYEGLRSLEVVIAAYRSARDGVRVGLPLVF